MTWLGCRKPYADARRREIPLADIEGKAINPNPIPHSLGDIVAECVLELSEVDQEALRAYFTERMTLQEMAEEYGLSDRRGSAWRVKAALRRLQAKLAERGITYE